MADKWCTTYFWTLDSELPSTLIKDYRSAVMDETEHPEEVTGALANTIRLLDAKVPLTPKAYLTSSFIREAQTKLSSGFFEELTLTIARFEKLSHQKLGGSDKPLLLTVQGDFCGTVRNIGVHPEALQGLIHQYGQGTAYTLYVDFLESFSTLILACPHVDFRKTFNIKAEREGGVGGLAELEPNQFLKRVIEYQNLVSQKIGRPFPDSIERQLLAALIHCAKTTGVSGHDEIFIKVQVHRSTYGQSVHGVAYTRNPFTGKQDLYGVYQGGESGEKHPLEPDTAPAGSNGANGSNGHKNHGMSLREAQPATFALIKRFLPEVEASFRDVMEVEFVTDEDGHLYFTNFDKASTTAKATVVSSIELNLAGKISDDVAASRIKPADVEVLLHPTLDDHSRASLEDLGSKGVTAAPGTAVGRIFFTMQEAMEHYKAASAKKQDKRVILIANELLISDTPGLGIISGLVTKASGIASHAAVMARANGIPCIVGYKGLEFDSSGKSIVVNGKKIETGTMITLEAGSDGKLYFGEGSLQNLSFKEGVVRDVSQLMTRVLKNHRVPMQVRVNINNAKDAETGLSFGADGVGLCRTENMFMEESALREVRNVVFTQDASKCGESFQKLEETQYQDFKKVFEVMKGRIVNIRLMDLPLHDFVPQTEKDLNELCKQLPHLTRQQIELASDGMREHNPMLGLRACRFGLIMPEIYNMQMRAIVRAAYTVTTNGFKVDPGIMFPLVFTEVELSKLRTRVVEIEEQVREELKIPYGTKIKFRVGSMIELPAAAMSADQLARVGEFFAFGTNDLTQTTLGISRDDSAHYLPFYLENGILPADPFKVLAHPVRELIETAVMRGRRVRVDGSYGICGEQGGDRATLQFCLEKGLDYVSCSPFRVLPSRVALVHEALTMMKLGEKLTYTQAVLKRELNEAQAA